MKANIIMIGVLTEVEYNKEKEKLLEKIGKMIDIE